MLKTDLHIHTKEDPRDIIRYNAKQLIDLAAKKRFEVLSITLHKTNFYPSELVRHAKKKGILLIPGREALIEGKDVLIYNYHDSIKKISHLDKVGEENGLVIAPHPYFIKGPCLGGKLKKFINNFDAIEYCHYYWGFINLNNKSVRVARKYKKPLVGTSDAHYLYEFGTTYSILDCEQKIDSVLEAIRKGKLKAATRPMTFKQFIHRTISTFFPKR